MDSRLRGNDNEMGIDINKQLKPFLTIMVVPAVFLFSFLICQIAKAAPGDITGWAWSEHYGWISFSSRNCDIDGDGEFEGPNEGDPAGSTPAPTDCPTSGTAHSYGVTANLTTGNLSNYAWNDYLGWISFENNGNTPDNSVIVSNCDSSCAPPVCTACYRRTSGERIFGWAKVLSLDDDGWIRLDDHNGATSPNYGITHSNGQLHGWAWGGAGGPPATIGIGWVSFNCDGGGPNGEPYCVADDPVNGVDYWVAAAFNAPPTAVIGPVGESNLCIDPYYLYFYFSMNDIEDGPGADPSGHEIQIKWDNQTWSELQESNYAENSSAILYSWTNPQFSNTRTYDFRVRVKDSGGLWSVWTYGNHNPENHDYPNVSFDWSPATFSVAEEVLFTGTASYYNNAQVENDCTGICTYLWTLDPGVELVSPSTLNDWSINVRFTEYLTNKNIKLTVTDPDGNFCEYNMSGMTANYRLPTWVEWY